MFSDDLRYYRVPAVFCRWNLACSRSGLHALYPSLSYLFLLHIEKRLRIVLGGPCGHAVPLWTACKASTIPKNCDYFWIFVIILMLLGSAVSGRSEQFPRMQQMPMPGQNLGVDCRPFFEPSSTRISSFIDFQRCSYQFRHGSLATRSYVSSCPEPRSRE